MTKEEVKNKILGFIEAVESIEIESEFQSLRESGLDSLGLVSVIVSSSARVFASQMRNFPISFPVGNARISEYVIFSSGNWRSCVYIIYKRNDGRAERNHVDA